MAAPVVADNDTKRAAVGHVLAVIASLSRTALHFGVEIAELKDWLHGSTEVPKTAFLTAVEFLLNTKDSELRAAKNIVERSELPAMTPALERLLQQRRN